jgi:hypothetical protein
MSELYEEVRQRMMLNGAYNVPLLEIERRWDHQFDRDATAVEDFIGWCKRSGWRATIKDRLVEARR